MRYRYEGHDAAGKERSGVVEAKSIEEAAGIVRITNKVYARKIAPDETQVNEVDTKAEALRQVRAQAEVSDNVGYGSKPHVYDPGQREQANPAGGEVTENPFGCEYQDEKTKPEPKEELYDGGSDTGDDMGGGPLPPSWQEILANGVTAANKVTAALKGEFTPEVLAKLRLEMIKEVAIIACGHASVPS